MGRPRCGEPCRHFPAGRAACRRAADALTAIPFDVWDATTLEDQQRVIGRDKLTGAPLGGHSEYDPIDLQATARNGALLIPVDAHVRLASQLDSHGQRIIRRGYSYSGEGAARHLQSDAPYRACCPNRCPDALFDASEDRTTCELRSVERDSWKPPAGLEPATLGLEIRRSIQLSYGGAMFRDVSDSLVWRSSRMRAGWSPPASTTGPCWTGPPPDRHRPLRALSERAAARSPPASTGPVGPGRRPIATGLYDGPLLDRAAARSPPASTGPVGTGRRPIATGLYGPCRNGPPPDRHRPLQAPVGTGP
jgi:hypothetical protein